MIPSTINSTTSSMISPTKTKTTTTTSVSQPSSYTTSLSSPASSSHRRRRRRNHHFHHHHHHHHDNSTSTSTTTTILSEYYCTSMKQKNIFLFFFLVLNVLVFIRQWNGMPCIVRYEQQKRMMMMTMDDEQYLNNNMVGRGNNEWEQYPTITTATDTSSSSTTTTASLVPTTMDFLYNHPRIHFNRPRIVQQEEQWEDSNQQHHQQHHYSNMTTNTTDNRIEHAAGNGKKRRFAYAFLLGGHIQSDTAQGEGTSLDDDTNNNDYRGGLYSIITIVHTLRRHGSKADMVLFVQLATTTTTTTSNFWGTTTTTLSPIEEEMVQKMDIRIQYIPKYSYPPTVSSSDDVSTTLLLYKHRLIMEKFRILSLDDRYDRVMYLDYDNMIPKCNLDYMLELSSGGTGSSTRPLLKENVVIAHRTGPASGGMFILRPNKTDYIRLLDIIHQHKIKALEDIPYPHWDSTNGWGHSIVPPDYWRVVKGIDTTGSDGMNVNSNWSWRGSYSDEGLLYYWTKYVQQAVSIIVGSQVEQWGIDPTNNKLVLERIDYGTIGYHSCSPGPTFTPGASAIGAAPYRDFRMYVTGMKNDKKVWHHSREELDRALKKKRNVTSFSDYSYEEQWYWLLKDALNETGMLGRVSLDFIKPAVVANRSVVTRHATTALSQRATYLRTERANGWRQYEEDEEYRNSAWMNQTMKDDVDDASSVAR